MRTLKVKCPTWRHVETFYERKLRPDRTLTIRVPFAAEPGSAIMLGLELPDGTVIAIEGTVQGLAAGEPGQRGALTLLLHGLTDVILGRLRTLVAVAESRETPATVDETLAHRTGRGAPPSAMPGPGPDPLVAIGSGPTARGVPAALPEDVPISEPVVASARARERALDQSERAVYQKLDSELANLRELAAHEVLGVATGADVAEVRRNYFACTKRYHPDLFARHRSPPIMRLAQEVFIHINRAYDRMRNSLVAEGHAVAAGPALLAHDGWMAGFEDIETGDADDLAAGDEMAAGDAEQAGAADMESAVLRAAARVIGVPDRPRAAPVSELRARIDAHMAAGDYEAARSVLADVLHSDPRNRQLRALYYWVSGQQALAEGDRTLAATQFDAALAHDRECHEARSALDELLASDGSSLPRFLR